MQIRDETPQRNTITLSKFAQHVGRSVHVSIKVGSSALTENLRGELTFFLDPNRNAN